MEEYMLRIHEAVAVIHRAYPMQVADQGKKRQVPALIPYTH